MPTRPASMRIQPMVSRLNGPRCWLFRPNVRIAPTTINKMLPPIPIDGLLGGSEGGYSQGLPIATGFNRALLEHDGADAGSPAARQGDVARRLRRRLRAPALAEGAVRRGG